jgi:hypothetical protein
MFSYQAADGTTVSGAATICGLKKSCAKFSGRLENGFGTPEELKRLDTASPIGDKMPLTPSFLTALKITKAIYSTKNSIAIENIHLIIDHIFA